VQVALSSDDADRLDRLLSLRHGTTADGALAFVDALPGVPVHALHGRWHGSGWHSGHPWDGLLEAFDWYGKEFLGADDVRPLLVRDRAGNPLPVDPALVPVWLVRRRPDLVRHPAVRAGFRAVRPLLASTRPAGRLRLVQHRGVVTAALVYDDVPIIDVFRRVTDDVVVGAADIRGESAPLLFVLRRSPQSPAAEAWTPAGGDAAMG